MKVICFFYGHSWRTKARKYMSDFMVRPSDIFIGDPSFNRDEHDYLMKLYNSIICEQQCHECGKKRKQLSETK